MPQLNPSPWFFILILSWSLLIFLIPTKMTQFQHLNEPHSKTPQTMNKSWPWPWT